MIDEALKEIRERRKLTVKEVASAVGVSQRVYYNWEAGITAVPVEYIALICKALNVSTDYLLNYGKMSIDEFQEKYNIAQGVITALQRNEANKDLILWLFNDSDIDIEGLVLVSAAYSVISPRMRRHLSAIVWSSFRDAVQSDHITNKTIAKRLIDSEPNYMRLWNELNGNV